MNFDLLKYEVRLPDGKATPQFQQRHRHCLDVLMSELTPSRHVSAQTLVLAGVSKLLQSLWKVSFCEASTSACGNVRMVTIIGGGEGHRSPTRKYGYSLFELNWDW